MRILRKEKIPIAYTQLPFLRETAPILIADCPEDLSRIEELKNYANGSISISQNESDYIMIIGYDIDDNINSYHGDTGEVIESKYYYYKAWDVEYLIDKRMPAESVLFDELNIDSEFLYNLGERKSCIPFLKMASEYLKNPMNAGYKIKDGILDKINEIENKLFLSFDMRKFKNIDTSTPKSKQNTSLSLKQREYILQRDFYRCFFCGATSEDNQLEVNHIIPKSLIEKLNLDEKLKIENYNLCTTCFSCNRGKKDYLTMSDINYYIEKIDKKSENHEIVKYLLIIKNLQNL